MSLCAFARARLDIKMIQILLLTLVSSANTKGMDPFIVGGQEVSINKWPFITFIYGTMGKRMATACGGSLISAQTVLTAAHCVDDFTSSKANMSLCKFDIFMGHSSYLKATLTRTVLDYTSHQDYDPYDDDVIGDIAVLFLKNPVKFSGNVKKVLLQQRSFDGVKDNNVEVAGWGATSTNEKKADVAVRLKAALLNTIDLKKCRHEMQSNLRKVICTKPSRSFAYSGDSGGPLMKRNKPYQIGIVSFRDEDVLITAFTSVPDYYKWINNTQFQLYKKYCPRNIKGSCIFDI